MAAQDLEAHLQLYQTQLEQIQTALSADPGNSELVELKTDLESLIELTRQSLLEEKKKELMALFEDDEPVEAQEEEEEADLDLSNLPGMKCRAPHASLTGSSRHNGIIFQVEEASEEGEDRGGQVHVRVVFSHPTSHSMRPCPFYMKGRCRFEDENCKYSHGEVVSLTDITEYEEPIYSNLQPGTSVLAQSEDDALWQHARVEGVEAQTVHLRLVHDHARIHSLPLERVWPLLADDDDSDAESPSTEEAKPGATPSHDGSSLGLIGTASALGDWEKHTRGMGSRLMAQMGYVTGTGLGRASAGRTEPVPVIVYPQGQSLDWCMEKRLEAGGGDAVSVECTMERQRKREEKQSQRRYAAEKKKEARQNSLFGVINRLGPQGKKVGGPSSGRSNPSGPEKPAPSLRVESFKLSEAIVKIKRDITSLKASHARHKDRDLATARGIMVKIRERQSHLCELEKKERQIQGQQAQADRVKKLAIF